MTFNEAIECLLKGERVRCKSWFPAYFIEYAKDDSETNYDVIHQYYNDTDRGIICYCNAKLEYKPFFSLAEVMGEWELYTDKLSQNNEKDNRGSFMPDQYLEWREPKGWKK